MGDWIMTKASRDFQVFVKPIGSICNLDCHYCYYLKKGQLYPKGESFRMADDILKDYIVQHIKAHPEEVIRFSWHGGEPTILGLDYFRRIVALQYKHNTGLFLFEIHLPPTLLVVYIWQDVIIRTQITIPHMLVVQKCTELLEWWQIVDLLPEHGMSTFTIGLIRFGILLILKIIIIKQLSQNKEILCIQAARFLILLIVIANHLNKAVKVKQ